MWEPNFCVTAQIQHDDLRFMGRLLSNNEYYRAAYWKVLDRGRTTQVASFPIFIALNYWQLFLFIDHYFNTNQINRKLSALILTWILFTNFCWRFKLCLYEVFLLCKHLAKACKFFWTLKLL